MKYSWLFCARFRRKLDQSHHLPILKNGPGNDDCHSHLLSQQLQSFVIGRKTAGADERSGDLYSPHLEKFYDLIEVSHADGQNRPGLCDLALMVRSSDGGRNPLQNNSGAALLQVFKLPAEKNEAEVTVLPTGVKVFFGMEIQISVFDLVQSETIVPVQKQIRIDESRRVGQDFFQSRGVKPNRRIDDL